jgi:hypothetical protein
MPLTSTDTKNMLRGNMNKPSPQEGALLLLRAAEERGDRRGKELTRARLSSLTLQRLFRRESLDEIWLAEVNQWLLSAGWTLFRGGRMFAMVKTSVIENWPRVASKHLEDVLTRVDTADYDFSEIASLLEGKPSALSTLAAATTARKPAEKARNRRNR